MLLLALLLASEGVAGGGSCARGHVGAREGAARAGSCARAHVSAPRRVSAVGSTLMPASARVRRVPHVRRAAVQCKGRWGYRKFDVSMWYPNADLSSPADAEWISAYAPHHTKLQQLELEVERCEFLLDEAVAKESYDEAEGLRERIERLRATHPIWSVEEDLSDAIVRGDFDTAQRLHSRLEDIRWNLGLPRFLVGQVVQNRQGDWRGVVVSVDLHCQMDERWLKEAYEANALRLDEHAANAQPWYTCLVDVRDDELTPRELYTHQVNRYSQETRPPVYLPQEAIAVCQDDNAGFEHPLLSSLFESATAAPAPSGTPVGLGVRFKPTIKLRFWQRAQHARLQRRR